MSSNEEEWTNNTGSSIFVKVADPMDHRSNIGVAVRPGDTLYITTTDRVKNQRSYKDARFDFFENGMLTPVTLFETSEEYEKAPLSEGVKTESDLVEMLKLSASKLKTELASIDSPLVVQRLQKLAEEDDKITASKAKAIEARAEELAPSEDDMFVGYDKGGDPDKPQFPEIRMG